MIKIKIKLLSGGKLPVKATIDAACYDVYAREIEVDAGYINAKIKLGFSTEIPKGYKGVLVPRSSFTNKGWVMANSPGQIDSDYRGEWMMKLESLDSTGFDFPFNEGDRVGQMYFEKVLDTELEITEDLSETERGDGGFGSTGKSAEQLFILRENETKN